MNPIPAHHRDPPAPLSAGHPLPLNPSQIPNTPAPLNVLLPRDGSIRSGGANPAGAGLGKLGVDKIGAGVAQSFGFCWILGAVSGRDTKNSEQISQYSEYFSSRIQAGVAGVFIAVVFSHHAANDASVRRNLISAPQI